MATPAPDMQALLSALAALGGKPIETLTPVEARQQSSPTDAVMQVMRAKRLPTTPDGAVTTTDRAYGSHPMQKARIYNTNVREV